MAIKRISLPAFIEFLYTLTVSSFYFFCAYRLYTYTDTLLKMQDCDTFTQVAGRHSHCPVSTVQLLAVYTSCSFQFRVAVFITAVLTSSCKPASVAADSYAIKTPKKNYSVRKHLPSDLKRVLDPQLTISPCSVHKASAHSY